MSDTETIPAVLILRFDLDLNGRSAIEILREVREVLTPATDAWIGINEYAEQVDALLVTFGQGPRAHNGGMDSGTTPERDGH